MLFQHYQTPIRLKQLNLLQHDVGLNETFGAVVSATGGGGGVTVPLDDDPPPPQAVRPKAKTVIALI